MPPTLRRHPAVAAMVALSTVQIDAVREAKPLLHDRPAHLSYLNMHAQVAAAPLQGYGSSLLSPSASAMHCST